MWILYVREKLILVTREETTPHKMFNKFKRSIGIGREPEFATGPCASRTLPSSLSQASLLREVGLGSIPICNFVFSFLIIYSKFRNNMKYHEMTPHTVGPAGEETIPWRFIDLDHSPVANTARQPCEKDGSG